MTIWQNISSCGAAAPPGGANGIGQCGGVQSRASRGGSSVLRSLAAGPALAALFAAGAVVVQGYVAWYTGSYLPFSVVAMVSVLWACAAVAVAISAGILALPLLFWLKGRRRAAIMPGIVVAGGFLVNALVMKGTFRGCDPVGASYLLNDYMLGLWGAVIGVTTGLLIARAPRTSPVQVALVVAASVLFASGASYFVWEVAKAYVLVIGPLALTAVIIGTVESMASFKARTAALAGGMLMLGGGLVVIGMLAGQTPLRPMNRQFKSDPGKVAMLAGKPNVIIIVLDTVRADHMSLCGYAHPTTPALEELAEDCRLFPFGESVDSWTLPAHASLFTGKYPRQHGAHADSSPGVDTIERYRPYGIPLALAQTTLPEYLSMKGYNTCAIMANYTWLCRQFQVDQGFYYYGDLPRLLLFTPGRSPAYAHGLEILDRLLGCNGKLLQPFWDAGSVTDMATDWVEENKGSPFFLFVNYMDAHYPYAASPPYDAVNPDGAGYDMRLRQRTWQELITRYINTRSGVDDRLMSSAVRQYDGSIAYMDRCIGDLAGYLKRKGLYDDTLLIVTSDHGEFFGEHGLLNHGVGIYEAGTRIAILVKYPNRQFAGERREERVSIIDIFATVFDVLKLPMPEVPAVPLGSVGRSIYAEDYENGMNVKRYGKRFEGNRAAVYAGDRKLITSTTARAELYNVTEDPLEEENLASREQEMAQRLLAEIALWRETTPPFDGRQEAVRPLSAAEIEKLRSIGYIGGD